MKLHYYDANCLVKLVVKENDSQQLKDYFYESTSTVVTTSFCFHEALGVLKSKWVQSKRSDTLTQEEYLVACEELCALVNNEQIQLEEISLQGANFFGRSETLTQKYGIDLSDSFQLVALKEGMMAQLQTSLVPELVTEDKELAKAAKGEGLIVRKISDLKDI